MKIKPCQFCVLGGLSEPQAGCGHIYISSELCDTENKAWKSFDNFFKKLCLDNINHYLYWRKPPNLIKICEFETKKNKLKYIIRARVMLVDKPYNLSDIFHRVKINEAYPKNEKNLKCESDLNKGYSLNAS